MKKLSDLMAEIGFNPEASMDAKKAFIKHLIKEAHFQEVVRTKKNDLVPVVEDKKEESAEVQLSLFPLTGTDK